MFSVLRAAKIRTNNDRLVDILPMTSGRYTRCLTVFMALTAALYAQPAPYSFQDAQAFLKAHCQSCHQGSSPAGGFDLKQTASAGSIRSEATRWSSVALRVRNGEMPPALMPGPTLGQREQFTNWVTAAVSESACAAGVMPATSGIRRLNRDEYAATVRDLLDIQVDFTSALPADGAMVERGPAHLDAPLPRRKVRRSS